jgi:hypothetical protein
MRRWLKPKSFLTASSPRPKKKRQQEEKGGGRSKHTLGMGQAKQLNNKKKMGKKEQEQGRCKASMCVRG